MGDDEALFDRWRAGDMRAGNRLFESHYALVYRFFEIRLRAKQDLDDLVQATFEASLKSRYKFREAGDFRRFVMGSAWHVYCRYLRQRTRKTVEIESEELISEPRDGAEADLFEAEALIEALYALPIEQLMLLELHYFRDLERDELAEVFQVSPAAVSRQLRVALRALRALLEHSVDVPGEPRDTDLDRPPEALSSRVTSHSPDRASRDGIVLYIRKELGENPWVEIAEALHDVVEQDPNQELTLPELVELAERRGFAWQDVHIVVEKLAQGRTSFLERQFLSLHDYRPAVVSSDEAASRVRASMEDEGERGAWREWARGVRVVWRWRSHPSDVVESAS